MKRLPAVNTGSNYMFQDKMLSPNYKSSMFDLSHRVTATIPEDGANVPILCLETVPTDNFQIQLSTLLRSLPSVVPMYSKKRISVSVIWNRLSDLWNHSQIFITKGYSGNEALRMPTLNTTNCALMADPDAVVKSDDLLHYLYKLPIGTKYSSYNDKLSALPAMQYLRFWRDYVMNTYYYTDNREFLPYDDGDFRLNDLGELMSDKTFSSVGDLATWRYRDFADDRFTSGAPSPQRGDTPILSFNISDSKIPVVAGLETGEFFDYVKSFDFDSGALSEKLSVGDSLKGSFVHYPSSPFHSGSSSTPFTSGANNLSFFSDLSKTGDLGLEITANNLRQLAISQAELERMARTDGSYEQFGLSFYGVSSKSAYDYRAVYCGGSVEDIVFTEVIQTSQSTNDSFLGQYAGHGISASGNNVATLQCDDYGYLMVIASVLPDTYYSQGIDRQFTRLYQSDFFLPGREKLGMQPVLNKEIYWQGTQDDEGLFCYQDIYDEMRYRENCVLGKLADRNAESFFPYTQSRYFERLPVFGQSFASMKNNVRMDYLAAHDEVPYTADFAFNIRAVRPLPYKATPGSLIS